MAKKYSAVLKTIWLAAFYAYIIPFGIFISLGSLFITYWTDKVF